MFVNDNANYIPVSAEHAKEAAIAIVKKLHLPNEASDGIFELVVFNNEKDCRFFYPRRALQWQLQVNTYLSRALRQRGIRVQRALITPADYESWRGEREDSETLRRHFADQHQRLSKR